MLIRAQVQSGHSKVINAVALRPNRPFRAVTGGDDRTLVFSHGGKESRSPGSGDPSR